MTANTPDAINPLTQIYYTDIDGAQKVADVQTFLRNGSVMRSVLRDEAGSHFQDVLVAGSPQIIINPNFEEKLGGPETMDAFKLFHGTNYGQVGRERGDQSTGFEHVNIDGEIAEINDLIRLSAEAAKKAKPGVSTVIVNLGKKAMKSLRKMYPNGSIDYSTFNDQVTQAINDGEVK